MTSIYASTLTCKSHLIRSVSLQTRPLDLPIATSSSCHLVEKPALQSCSLLNEFRSKKSELRTRIWYIFRNEIIDEIRIYGVRAPFSHAAMTGADLVIGLFASMGPRCPLLPGPESYRDTGEHGRVPASPHIFKLPPFRRLALEQLWSIAVESLQCWVNCVPTLFESSSSHEIQKPMNRLSSDFHLIRN